jgi:integrase
VRSTKGKPDASELYGALVHWAFNRPIREASEGKPPEKYADAIRWIEANSIPLPALMDPATVRTAYNSITIKADGTKYAVDTFTRKRTVLTGAVKHAIESGLLDTNPLEQVRPEAPRKSKSIDRRSVVNIDQARALINAVGDQGPSGPRLVAFFAVLYFAGLRPSEAIDLRVDNCTLPKSGWGELVFANANPYSGSEWTDNHEARQRKELKHRAVDEARHTPACPELVAHLRRHMAEFGTAPDGRIFQSIAGEVLSQGTYDRIWKKARKAALTTAQEASTLGLRPYDLRHACVSTWLNAGVHAPLVAEWAGHSVEVLLTTYAKCIDGQEEAARKRIADALGGVNASSTEEVSEPSEDGETKRTEV